MIRFMGLLLLVGLVTLHPVKDLHAQEEISIESMTLEDLLNINVQIAGKTKQTIEQAPSIMSVVTRSDIETYGFRDLADILHSVPGFQFGIDALNIYGTSFRGIWGHEGKILIMVNGVQVQDYGFGLDNQIGSYPAQLIERVEVIRGPGSALYGGFAEVAVIDIHTREVPEAKSFVSDLGISATGNQVGKGAFFAGQMKTANGSKLSAHVGYSTNPTADREYVDFSGGRYQMGQTNSPRIWRHAITTAETKNLKFQYTNTSFTYYGQDGYDQVIPPVQGRFNMERNIQAMETATLIYRLGVGESFKVIPKLEYTSGNDSNTAVFPAAVTAFGANTGVTLTRFLAELGASYEPTKTDKVLFGAGYIVDGVENALVNGDPGIQSSPDPTDLDYYIERESKYVYGQYMKQWQNFGAVLGARHESTFFGDAFAPRMGLTYVNGAFNAKALYGRAYRVPMPWQVYSRFLTYPVNPLRPETADSFEVELGYKFTSNLAARINGFVVQVKDPLVYSSVTFGYTNLSEIQSTGFEGELNWKHPTYGATANVAYNKPSSSTNDGFLTEDKNEFLGMAPIKINVLGYYKTGKYSFGPSVTYISERKGQTTANAMTNKTFPAIAVANFRVNAEQVFQDTDFHLTVNNIANQEYLLIQPYYGNHAPVPVFDRQVSLGATMKF